MEMEITKKKSSEGVHYKNVFSFLLPSLVMPIPSLSPGLLLPPEKYGQDIQLLLMRTFSVKKSLKNTALNGADFS